MSCHLQDIEQICCPASLMQQPGLALGSQAGAEQEDFRIDRKLKKSPARMVIVGQVLKKSPTVRLEWLCLEDKDFLSYR
jgi:hypothetical protein